MSTTLDITRQRLLMALGTVNSPLTTIDLWNTYLNILGILPGKVLVERLRAYAPTLPGREWQALPTTPVFFSAASPPAGQVGVAYSYQFLAQGGSPPYTFSIQSGDIPSGLTLSPNGLLSGTPDTEANYSFTIAVTDAVGISSPVNRSINIIAA